MDTPPLIASGVTYYHLNDELLFFARLERIPCVSATKGVGLDLFIELKAPPTDDDLRQLLALFHRYGIEMRQLSRFEGDANRSWFRDKRKYWYRSVFGRTRAEKPRGAPKLS